MSITTAATLAAARTKMFKARMRKDYPYFLTYHTRWSDNDAYSHMNNAMYYHLFDSIVNAYLIEKCGLKPGGGAVLGPKSIGLVVSSFCEYFKPVGFPEPLDLGLRVTSLGTSSVSYEVAVFGPGADQPAAVGGYTHVFVDSETRKPRKEGMETGTREGLSKLLVEEKAKL